jgi:hypothetical protein
LIGGQSPCYHQWCCYLCHGQYGVNIVAVAVAAHDNGSSSSSLNQQNTLRTTIAAANPNGRNQVVAVSTEESTFFLPALS